MIVRGTDSSEGAYESLLVEGATSGVVWLNVEKDGHRLGLHVERAELEQALEQTK